MSSPHPEPTAPPGRDPQAMLARMRHHWGGRGDLWVFGYASLIWRPGFDAAEHRVATVHGWHRALQMRSRINRGTPERPGLVCALVSGGSCRGVVYRIRRRDADETLQTLWEREMITGVYDPRFVACRTAHGTASALAFTLSRSSPSHTGHIGDDEMLQILRTAAGRYGSTLEYLRETARSLRERGIVDRGLERLTALAHRHGL
jgi:glutathione-specific gamma-glutamylcyclotransferase